MFEVTKIPDQLETSIDSTLTTLVRLRGQAEISTFARIAS